MTWNATISATWPRAAKQHRCEWCGDPIPVGEVHFRYVGRYEGDWQDWRMHRECHGAWEAESVDTDGEFLPYENARPDRDPTPAEVRTEREQAGQLRLVG